jgi:hypothetical protein
MDLRGYYRKMRELEATLADESVVVKSLATEAGGKAGRLTEVRRETAARLIVDGLAEAASEKEAAAYRRSASEASQKELERRAASQVQFTVISEADLRALSRSPAGKRKE